jgi:hypothetical protein
MIAVTVWVFTFVAILLMLLASRYDANNAEECYGPVRVRADRPDRLWRRFSRRRRRTGYGRA